MPTSAAFGIGQHIDLDELGSRHALDDELGDAIAPVQCQRRGRVVVDDDHLDLAPVAGVNRARCVHQPESGASRQPGAGVYERGIAGRQRDGQTCRNNGTHSGFECHVLSRHDVGAGIARHRIAGKGDIAIEALHLHLDTTLGGTGNQAVSGRHGAERYPRRVPASSETPPNSQSSAASYDELLRTPWWWYLVAVFVASLLAAEFHISGLSLTDWIPFGTLLPLSVVIVWWLGRSRVRIAAGELRVRGAHLPLSLVSGAVALDAPTLRRVVGREGDPAAFISIRPWIGPGAQLWLDDPDDPTPYWIVSTRHPDELVSVIRNSVR